MSTRTVDTLVTKYTMDASDYQAGARSVQNATGTMGNGFAFAGSGAASLAGNIAVLVGTAAVAGAAMASSAASDMEVLRQSLEVVTGSADRASQVFEFVKQQAAPSAFFDARQLGEAAKLLEAFSLKTERFLPLANTMASVFGQNEESLQGFVNALGRIRGGSFGEGFERLREMGLNREILEKQGLKFDKSGQFTGTIDEALTGIEKAIKTKFAGMDAAMGNTFAAQRATLQDLTNQALAQFGQVLNDEATPALQGFSSTVGDLVNAGAFEDFANGLRAVVQNINDLGLNQPGNLWDMVTQWFGSGTAEINKRTAEMQQSDSFKRAMESLNSGSQPFEPLVTEVKEAKTEFASARGYLAEVARNTRESLDLQKIALGAGASAVGITSVELSDMGRTRGGGKVARLLQELTGAIAEDAIRLAEARDAQKRAVFGR